MFSTARRHGPLSITFVALCIAAATQVIVVRTQSAAQSRRTTVTVDGHEAVAGEVLVQFANIPSAGRHGVLAQQSDADENVPVGRRGLRRFRSRSFDVETLVQFFRGQPDVVFAEPNYILYADATPNDPEFPNLWGLLNTGQFSGTPGSDIDATQAWDVSTGSTANVVGIIDTGIDYTHPDLAANVWSAPGPLTVTIGGTTFTCPAGSHGFNSIPKPRSAAVSCDPMDDNDHGTHVAGTIGAVGNNGVGVVGVNWIARMIGGKFLSAGGTGSTADAIDVIDFMIQAKAAFASTGGANIRVLNNSWGGGPFSGALQTAISNANSSGMLFAAAAGNGGADQIGDDNDLTPHYPSSYPVANVVSVAATTSQDVKAGFSNYGAMTVHLAAPGQTIRSTIRGGAYQYFSGTSMATPHVAGAAALVLSNCPSLTTAQLKSTLLSNVDVLPSLTGLVSTNGRLNVDRAIRSCGAPVDQADLVETAVSNPPATTAPGTSFAVTDTAANNGAAASGASTTRYYLSLDMAKSGGDVLLTGTRSVPALAVSATSTGTVSVTVPGGTSPNSYFLLACADDTSMVSESNESNNCIASASQVQITAPALPDLVVSSLANPPLTGRVGTKFSVTDTTLNQGAGAGTVQTNTRYYLSLDATKSGGDRRLKGAHVVPALGAGGSDTKTRSVTIPSATAPNVYFMIACADDKKTQPESNEANNCRTATTQITVTP